MSTAGTHYGKIGFFVLAGIVATIAALVRFGGMGDASNAFMVETYYDSAVSGLDVGSSVNYRGVKVGSVNRISFVACEYPEADRSDAQKIWIEIALDRRLLHPREGVTVEELTEEIIARGLHATVSASGVTGLSHIEMNYPKSKIVDKPISWKPRTPCIPPAPSILQSAADSATSILDQIDRIDFVETVSNINATARAAQRTCASLERLADSVQALVDAESAPIAEAVEDARAAIAEVRAAAAEIRANPSSLITSSDPEPLPETAR